MNTRNNLTTLCYLEQNDCYLMLHRTKKERDINKDKWVGIGGHFEADESPEECLLREAREETGLTLVRIDDVLDNSYSAIGFSNERNICIFGAAAGEFCKSTSDAEEIVPGWYTKEEMRELLRREPFAARTQAYCYAWANSEG